MYLLDKRRSELTHTSRTFWPSTTTYGAFFGNPAFSIMSEKVVFLVILVSGLNWGGDAKTLIDSVLGSFLICGMVLPLPSGRGDL